MESRPSPNVKPDVKSTASARSGGQPGGAGVTTAPVRRYPKPPALLPRFIMLCLRPESWAEAARYPTFFTILPLALALLLSAGLIAAAEMSRTFDTFLSFAQSYDHHAYPPLELHSDGTLSATGPLTDPIRIEFPVSGSLLLIDPTGKTLPETTKVPGVFITDKEMVLLSQEGPAMRFPLAGILDNPMSPVHLPPPGQTRRVDGPSIAAFLQDHRGEFVQWGILAAAMSFLSDGLWAAIMMFLLCPIVMLATAGPRLNPDAPDRRLILPRRAAYRMAAALLIPLVMLSAILRAIGHPVAVLLGGEGSLLFWFFSAGALAIWTGFMARRMYGNRDRRRT
jgi:hypothetical protein